MRREQRLRRGEDFSAVYRGGRSWVDRLLVLRAVPNGLDATRYGFSISKRVGNAVVRNRLKRRLREVVRSLAVRGGWDVVFIARQPAAEADYWLLLASVQSLLSRGRLLHKPAPDGGTVAGRQEPDSGETGD